MAGFISGVELLSPNHNTIPSDGILNDWIAKVTTRSFKTYLGNLLLPKNIPYRHIDPLPITEKITLIHHWVSGMDT